MSIYFEMSSCFKKNYFCFNTLYKLMSICSWLSPCFFEAFFFWNDLRSSAQEIEFECRKWYYRFFEERVKKRHHYFFINYNQSPQVFAANTSGYHLREIPHQVRDEVVISLTIRLCRVPWAVNRAPIFNLSNNYFYIQINCFVRKIWMYWIKTKNNILRLIQLLCLKIF